MNFLFFYKKFLSAACFDRIYCRVGNLPLEWHFADRGNTGVIKLKNQNKEKQHEKFTCPQTKSFKKL